VYVSLTCSSTVVACTLVSFVLMHYGRKVGRPMARVLKGPVRSRNGVDRHARGHMGAALARTLVDVLSSMKWPTMAHLHSRTWSAQQVQTVLNM